MAFLNRNSLKKKKKQELTEHIKSGLIKTAIMHAKDKKEIFNYENNLNKLP